MQQTPQRCRAAPSQAPRPRTCGQWEGAMRWPGQERCRQTPCNTASCGRAPLKAACQASGQAGRQHACACARGADATAPQPRSSSRHALWHLQRPAGKPWPNGTDEFTAPSSSSSSAGVSGSSSSSPAPQKLLHTEHIPQLQRGGIRQEEQRAARVTHLTGSTGPTGMRDLGAAAPVQRMVGMHPSKVAHKTAHSRHLQASSAQHPQTAWHSTAHAPLSQACSHLQKALIVHCHAAGIRSIRCRRQPAQEAPPAAGRHNAAL